MDEFERIKACAAQSIGKACGFAGLAIVTFMFGLSFSPITSLQVGAILTSMMVAVLAWKAARAHQQPYRRTETWLLMKKQHGLPEAAAQRVMAQALRDTYIRHAELAAGVVLVLCALCLVLAVLT
jgi:ferric-dicitrate binding protein FerR (iron transport regulator)